MVQNTSHDLHDFMAQASSEMAEEYERIRKRTLEDPGTAGDQGEENWAELLRGWLPSTYHVVTKGRLISTEGETSPQVDVLVLKPSYPKKLLNRKLYLAGGVAAVFECKTTLRANHIDEAVRNSVAVKRAIPPRYGTPYKELRSPIIFGLLAHSHDWQLPKSTPVENICENLKKSDYEHVDHPRLGIDLVCVADLANFEKSSFTCYYQDWLTRTGARYPATAMIAEPKNLDGQQEFYRPIGGFINNLIQKLAWEDTALRDIADYYRLTNFGGIGSGETRA
jgi:hypothetical protein